MYSSNLEGPSAYSNCSKLSLSTNILGRLTVGVRIFLEPTGTTAKFTKPSIIINDLLFKLR